MPGRPSNPLYAERGGWAGEALLKCVASLAAMETFVAQSDDDDTTEPSEDEYVSDYSE